MPFDGTHSRYTITPDQHTIASVKRAHMPLVKRANVSTRVKAMQIASWVVAFGVVCCAIEAVFPDRGPITLITDGPGVVHQNVIAYSIMNDVKRLEFTVNGHLYRVLTPGHALTADEQTAWLGFAKRKSYPAYSLDGPLAIDP